MTTPFKCPECGSPLDLDDKAETEQTVWHPNVGGMPYIETILRPCVIAACTGCEFVIEVKS
jgi:hypothetical protein